MNTTLISAKVELTYNATEANSRRLSQVETWHSGGSETVCADTAQTCDAIECSDLDAVTDGREVADKTRAMSHMISAAPYGRSLRDIALENWRSSDSAMACFGKSLTIEEASSLIAAYAREGNVAAGGALLGCLAGRAESVLLSHDALAVHAACGSIDMLDVMFSHLSLSAQTQALACRRGEALTALLKRQDTDELLGTWLDKIVKSGDSEQAAYLLSQSKDLLFVAIRGRRLSKVLERLVELAGPKFSEVFHTTRFSIQRFCQSKDG